MYMCHKVVSTFQQTFVNADASLQSQIFAFNRIYKSKPQQYFRISCVALTSISPSTKTIASSIHCGEMYLTGLPNLNKNCNLLGVDSGDIKHYSNAFYLGNLNYPGNINSFFMIDEIPLDNFSIANRQYPGQYTVSFHIELIEP